MKNELLILRVIVGGVLIFGLGYLGMQYFQNVIIDVVVGATVKGLKMFQMMKGHAHGM